MSAEGTDPLALIIAAGAACISGLAGVVVTIVVSWSRSQAKRITKLEDADKQELLAERIETIKARLDGVERQTLSRELFEQKTDEQNRALDDLKMQNALLANSVSKLDRTKASRADMPVAARIIQREEPESEPPPYLPPMRPKLPSRR